MGKVTRTATETEWLTLRRKPELRDPDRGTGRTTRQVEAAVDMAMKTGDVVTFVHQASVYMLCNMVRKRCAPWAPKWRALQQAFTFPNGGRLQFCGPARDLRGRPRDRVIYDHAIAEGLP